MKGLGPGFIGFGVEAANVAVWLDSFGREVGVGHCW